ncbi:ABC-type nitrate/sulfonate/bicarbonate transport system ATPase subunit [Devosia subaequoris]|uniref:ABC-type nitrate/sulfonate/bicarbonate transport system ATPase subunit n=1 Tax=Devosia subaequoris TaxID=395930 RepID=A0A7W6NAF8_9HYPH|nr:ABC transporter ATP-binding protein [Devosia subaequoris]MBB4050636.1 ABC-type nitrate/sulfonate/bicarbonate transport system ATPase subunit [Devosia subaequoris]MCP1208682.1 ABC transporter ATP-binding protein [Devosia subaequoris]
MSPLRLELVNLRKRFGATEVLDDISLTVPRGEFVSILGPSGAGKSTILQLLTGATAPDAGEMLMDGQPLARDRHCFAFMPQGDALMPWRRMLDNATLGLEVQGVGRKAARARVAPLFAEFGLAGFEHHYPAQLSGGMRQRAALLRTVVQQRPMLLLDEPFGALDALTRAQMQRWLATMWTRHRWTVLLITHDVREAVLLSDRIYVLTSRPARVAHQFHLPFEHPRQGVGSPALGAIEADILQTLLNPKD